MATDIVITSDAEIKDGSYLCIAIFDNYCKVIDSNCDMYTIYFNNRFKAVINKIALDSGGDLVIATLGNNKVIVVN